jgi:CMP/dCMP kinase
MKSEPKHIIAVDGYSSCGKSTFARLIARDLNYIYIDSGAMYRAVALYSLRNKLIQNNKLDQDNLVRSLDAMNIHFSLNSQTGMQETWLNGENIEKEIRGIEVSSVVSMVSKVKEVRAKMVCLQREITKKGSVVMDGRDIGTVVFPKAWLKIFMTADTNIRAQRRYKELQEKGIEAGFDEIVNNIRMRDYEDENREESPLRKADDAVVLDNSNMTLEQQMDWFRNLIQHHEH